MNTEHLPSKCPNPLGMLAAFPIKIRPRATADCFGFVLPTQVSLLIGHLTQRVPETSIKGACAGPEPCNHSRSGWTSPFLPCIFYYVSPQGGSSSSILWKSLPVAMDGPQGLAHAQQVFVPKLHPLPARLCSFVTGQLDILYFLMWLQT